MQLFATTTDAKKGIKEDVPTNKSMLVGVYFYSLPMITEFIVVDSFLMYPTFSERHRRSISRLTLTYIINQSVEYVSSFVLFLGTDLYKVFSHLMYVMLTTV